MLNSLPVLKFVKICDFLQVFKFEFSNYGLLVCKFFIVCQTTRPIGIKLDKRLH